MWERFFAEYNLVKGTSTKASSLARLVGLLGGKPGPKAPTMEELKAIERELREVKDKARGLFSSIFNAPPAVKYAKAIVALEEEIQPLKSEFQASASAAVSARVKQAKSSGATQVDVIDLEGSYATGSNPLWDKHRRWTAELEKRPTDQERRATMEQAFNKLLREPKFAQLYLDETGWTNVRAWLTWGLRSATPAMIAGPEARDAMEFLRELALEASVKDKAYAERYLLELSIYCSHEADRADVKFIAGQATSLIGNLCGPILSAALGGGEVVGWGVKAGKQALTTFGGKGAKSAFADSDGDTVSEGLMTGANVMRFTHAWLRQLTESRSLSAPARVIQTEFGGPRGCEILYERLMNL